VMSDGQQQACVYSRDESYRVLGAVDLQESYGRCTVINSLLSLSASSDSCQNGEFDFCLFYAELTAVSYSGWRHVTYLCDFSQSVQVNGR
jgi:hypothetical protein